MIHRKGAGCDRHTCYCIDELGDPMISEEHITAFNWATHQEIDDIITMTLRINDFLTGLFAGRWLDRLMHSGVFFSAPLVMLGAALGLWLAWKWMSRQ